MRVHVLNVNDNPPEFSEEAYEFHIPENMAGGSRVGMVMAIDRDSDIVTYELEEELASTCELFVLTADV